MAGPGAQPTRYYAMIWYPLSWWERGIEGKVALPSRGGCRTLVDMDWAAFGGEHGLPERLTIGRVRMDGRHDLINCQLSAHRQRVLGNEVGGVRPEDGRAQNLAILADD